MTIIMLEEYTCRTWPALETVAYDGWLLRFADGATNRANSVYPLYPSTYEIDRKLAYVEEQYAARGLKPVFKLTDAAKPPALDAVLASAGYVVHEPSLVMSGVLSADMPPDAAPDVRLSETFSDRWLDAYFEIEPSRASQQPVYAKIMNAGACRRTYASIERDGRIVAVGLGARSRDHVGIYNMATHPDYRGRGYAEAIVRSLQRDAFERGARVTFLSVSGGNETAQRLYRRCGLTESYRYCYRVKPAP